MSGAVTYGPSVVWRFEVAIDVPTSLSLPLSAEVLHVARDHKTPERCLSLWALVPVDRDGNACSPAARDFKVVGTGERITGGLEHHATVIDERGAVWHLFERSQRSEHLFNDLAKKRARFIEGTPE